MVGAHLGSFFEETTECERLDVSVPHDRKLLSTSATVPLERAEIRWLELYRKYQAAFQAENKPVQDVLACAVSVNSPDRNAGASANPAAPMVPALNPAE
jgi:hypothetical protein